MSNTRAMSRPTPEEIAAFRASGIFDEAWYLSEYLDVAKTRIDPAEHYLWIGQQIGRSCAPTRVAQPETPASEYGRWLARNDTITGEDIAAMKRAAAGWAHKPTFSVIMPVYNTPAHLLREAIDSILNQAYPHWELCVADDCSPSPRVRLVLDSYAARDQRIKIVYRETNGHISEASNSALSIATGEWYALMDHDDLLPPHALYCMAHAIVHNPDVKLLYSDEDKINPKGEREGPYFKCDFNLELFRSHNMISHLGVYHRSLIDQVGGFRTEFNGSQDYDLALRCIEVLRPDQIHHVPRVLYHWRMVEGSTALSNTEKPYAMAAGERAINAHYQRLGINAEAELIGFGYRSRYFIKNPPLVSIIIPTRNAKSLVEQCIESVLKITSYRRFEILLVDNGSDEAESLDYFKRIERNSIVRIMRDDRPFNYSALNNGAVKFADGEVLVFLNNDTEVISPEWLDIMVGLAIQRDVGAVGAKLLYPDERIQHAGVVMGLGGLAAHAHHFFGRNDPGFAGRLALANEYSAVTAACLVVEKQKFILAGGFNEIDLAVAYNDVDFCLKLRRLGFRNIYTPFAELYHYESATRGQEYENPEKQARFNREKDFMLRSWPDFIQYDPAYSPNLTLDAANFAYAEQTRVSAMW